MKVYFGAKEAYAAQLFLTVARLGTDIGTDISLRLLMQLP
jgi:hypothetical protein